MWLFLFSSSLPGASHILSWNARLALTALACPQVAANPSFLALSLGSPQKVSDLVLCGPEGTLAPLAVSIMRAGVALAGCSHIPGAPACGTERKKGRWCQASGLGRATLWQPRTGQEEGSGLPRVSSLCQICRARGVQVGRQARPGLWACCGSRPRHCLSVQQGGVSRSFPPCVCFPVLCPGHPHHLGNVSARISLWAGGQGKRAQAVVTGPPLCFCGKWA